MPCASRTTPSSPTGSRPGWSAATGRSTGCASRGSTRTPSSRPCSATKDNGHWRLAPQLRRHLHEPALPRRHDGPGVRVGRAGRDRPGHRLHAGARRGTRRRPDRRGRLRRRSPCAASCGCASATATSCRGCATWTGMLAAIAGPDSVWLASDVAHHGRDFASSRRLHRRGRRAGVLRADLAPVVPAPAAPGRPAAALDETERFWQIVVRPVHVRRARTATPSCAR